MPEAKPHGGFAFSDLLTGLSFFGDQWVSFIGLPAVGGGRVAVRFMVGYFSTTVMVTGPSRPEGTSGESFV
jgi:hypothetical protein